MRPTHCFLLLGFVLSACSTVKRYEDPDGPIFINNTMSEQLLVKEHYSIISFNIKESRLTEEAIDELVSNPDYSDPDILLLQEMNDSSVAHVGRRLNMNWVYYPIGTNTHDGSNFGNAILSKALISEPHKLILPHEKIDGRIRNAPNAIINIANQRVLVYSIHNETIWMKQSKRYDQMDAILSDINERKDKVDAIIVGGDFNTLWRVDQKAAEDKFYNAGLSRATKHLGATSRAMFGLIKPVNDHFFIKNIQPIKVDKLSSSKASDHWPILMVFITD